ncbi:hypothetical protein E2C01_038703 [Portunus trituberculatus]|uniref:Uncharacterized protein n=1 Tax=Portunus trituberculatus TaxID=210409 RepID=A0A5B7FBI1_PORTR|nr:hypothetical protein [Portunus trituberculatus]
MNHHRLSIVTGGGDLSATNSPRPINIKAPTTIRAVCTKSVHTTAARPPAMVKAAATTSRKRMLRYSHSTLLLFNANCINSAPAYRSACGRVQKGKHWFRKDCT